MALPTSLPNALTAGVPNTHGVFVRNEFMLLLCQFV